MTGGLNVLDDRLYTLEDYMKMDDGNRYELIGGKLIMTPSAKWQHQDVVVNLLTIFKVFLNQHPIGKISTELDVHLGDEVARPDILFISKERLDILGEAYPNAAPDLVIEVLSPSTAVHDKKTKSQLYYTSGVKEYWLVDPEAKLVDVFVAGENKWILMGVFDQTDTLTTSLLPGLEVHLKDVFM